MTREKGLLSTYLDCRDAGTESPSRRVDEIGFLQSKSPVPADVRKVETLPRAGQALKSSRTTEPWLFCSA